jgi:hypothetical protein
MDPAACLQRMLTALDDDDPADARDACHDLLTCSHGDVPELNKHALRCILRLAYERLIDLANEAKGDN